MDSWPNTLSFTRTHTHTQITATYAISHFIRWNHAIFKVDMLTSHLCCCTFHCMLATHFFTTMPIHIHTHTNPSIKTNFKLRNLHICAKLFIEINFNVNSIFFHIYSSIWHAFDWHFVCVSIWFFMRNSHCKRQARIISEFWFDCHYCHCCYCFYFHFIWVFMSAFVPRIWKATKPNNTFTQHTTHTSWCQWSIKTIQVASMVSFYSKMYFAFHKHHSIIPAFALSSNRLCEFLFTLPLFIYVHMRPSLAISHFYLMCCQTWLLHRHTINWTAHSKENSVQQMMIFSHTKRFYLHNLLNSILEHTVTLQELTQRPNISTTLIASFTFEKIYGGNFIPLSWTDCYFFYFVALFYFRLFICPTSHSHSSPLIQRCCDLSMLFAMWIYLCISFSLRVSLDICIFLFT